ncbi:tol-pal system protein YbgF [Sneathiella limimaris]|uniref:tol-pal system protein YbgF n=1 Tax=Sneathiella limimaris TaxID=1964213 RepID=UPI001469A4E6|nr:tol-pal system protein YbgF [Sneathiella limimaris]
MFKAVAVARDFNDNSGKSLLAKLGLLLVASGFVFFISNFPVKAQSSDVQALLDRINRLEADLNSVQRKVFQGVDVPPPASSSSSQPVSGGGEAFAILSARIDALEQEQRRLTGTTEEMNFKLDQMKSRMDKLVLDVDYRLTQIEQQLAGRPANQQSLPVTDPNANQASVSSTLPAPATNQAPSSVAEGGELPKGTQLLGTLPANNEGAPVTGTPATEQSVDLANAQPEELYNHAMGLIRSDDYAGAEQAFLVFLENNKTHSLAGNAQYWLGETYYVRGDYNNAASAFLNGYQSYPDSSKAADNLLKLGMTLGRMDQVKEACATFSQMEKQFKILPSRLKRIAEREKTKFKCT